MFNNMMKERKVIIRRVYDVSKAESLEEMLQNYLDENWEIDSINHGGETFIIVLSKNKEEVNL